MKATTIMLIAIGAALIGRWAHGQDAIPSAKGLVEVIFALLVIAFMDQGKTEPIAKGFAFLFLAAVLLSKNSPLTGLSKVSSKPIKPKKGS